MNPTAIILPAALAACGAALLLRMQILRASAGSKDAETLPLVTDRPLAAPRARGATFLPPPLRLPLPTKTVPGRRSGDAWLLSAWRRYTAERASAEKATINSFPPCLKY